MSKFGLSKRDFVNINEGELDEIVKIVAHAHPFCGENLIRAMLKNKGIHIQRSKLRECLHRIDPDGVEAR